MFIAMNRFRVAADRTDEFENAWRERESYLDETPGFVEFKLLRGAAGDGEVLYSSHTTWASKSAFDDWTNSDAFRRAHGQSNLSGVVLAHPNLEQFEVVL